MPYILSTEIPEKKPIKNALSSVFGIGKKNSQEICFFFGVSNKTRMNRISIDVQNKISNYVEKNIRINEDLIRLLNQSKEKNIKMKSYKGQRAKLKLPRRGQRTHTNAKTVKKLK